MASSHLCRLLAFLFLPAAACTVMGDEPPALDEIEAVRPIDIDVSAIRASNCGFEEQIDIKVTNSSSRDITTWALFSSVSTPDPWPVGPHLLAPGASMTYSRTGYLDEPDFNEDVIGARVFASNMDPSDPEPPAVEVSWSDRCENSDATWHATWQKVLAVPLDPSGVTNARQALADITPANCPLAEVSGALVENRSASEVSAWAAWKLDVEILSEEARQYLGGDQVTFFAPPVQIAPGSQFQFKTEMPPGYDMTEMAIMSNEPVSLGSDLAIAWLDTCATPSGE